ANFIYAALNILDRLGDRSLNVFRQSLQSRTHLQDDFICILAKDADTGLDVYHSRLRIYHSSLDIANTRMNGAYRREDVVEESALSRLTDKDENNYRQ